MVMVDVDDSSLLADSMAKLVGLVEGCWPASAQSAFIKWIGWTLAIPSPFDSAINVVISVNIIISTIVHELTLLW